MFKKMLNLLNHASIHSNFKKTFIKFMELVPIAISCNTRSTHIHIPSTTLLVLLLLVLLFIFTSEEISNFQNSP